MKRLDLPLADILTGWAPGSHDQPWSWDDEERELLGHACPSDAARRAGVVGATCPHGGCQGSGCYQRALESHLRRIGRIEQPVCLGTDGRVWDGHHRIVAARRLGITSIPIEEPVTPM